MPIARALQRALGDDCRQVGPGSASLEVTLERGDPARVREAALLADGALRAHPVPPAAPFEAPVVRAFLDGVQESRVVAYAGTIPIVRGRAAAVIRRRVDRRLVTWDDALRTHDALYLPLQAFAPDHRARLLEIGLPLVDTSEAAEHGADAHPEQQLRQALAAVQRQRETLEHALAMRWERAGDGLLYADGPLPPVGDAPRSGDLVGVVKSHRTLYVAGPALATVMSLGAGQRSSVLVLESARRAPVATWYLRVRLTPGQDPFWGMVRVECPLSRVTESDDGGDALVARLSSAVLQEAAPLALPDARWDTMAYGIRDCEVFLRAVLGPLGDGTPAHP